jgi:Mn-dependent DtxR family transcriptional regulator
VTPLSAKQRATLVFLTRDPASTAEIGLAIGVTKGAGTMLRSLHQQGLIAYVGGRGVKIGRGTWRLTDRGHAVAAEKE